MKLYVWPHCWMHKNQGWLFALASSQEEAIDQIIQSVSYLNIGPERLRRYVLEKMSQTECVIYEDPIGFMIMDTL